MRILLYGGSFDPPHYGHLNNLRAAAARVCPDRVVVMPAGVSPFKQGTSAPGPLRVEMCGCFAELAREMGFGLEVSGWEVEQAEQGRKNYSVLTLEKLARENPGDELYLAIGSDMLLSFDGWHRWEDILRLAHLVVTSRNIGDDPALHAKARQLDASGARILFAPVEALPMASSVLRTRLAQSLHNFYYASARADKLFRSAVGMAFARRRDGLLDKRPVDAARSDGRAVRRRGARILSRKKKSVRTDTARKGQKRRITTKGTVFRPFFNEFLPRGKNLFQSSYPLRACFPR